MMDEIEVVLYQDGVPVLKAVTNEVSIESNIDETVVIDREEDGKLQRIKVKPDLPSLKIKFKGTVVDMNVFDVLTKPREES